MPPFDQAISAWHDFYLMIGTAAATLVGLLFVSLALNVEMITREASSDLRELATHTFTIFISVLMFAVLFLIPSQAPLGLGLPLLGIGAYGLGTTASHFLGARPQARRKQSRLRGGSSIAIRFAVPALCFVTLMIIAASVLLGRTNGLYWLVPVMSLLLVAASRNAWDLLLRLRKPH